MGFGWGFGRDERLGRAPGLGLKVRSNLNISTMIGEGFDGGVELGHLSLELHPSGHGSKENSRRSISSVFREWMILERVLVLLVLWYREHTSDDGLLCRLLCSLAAFFAMIALGFGQ